jgi:hypothetical protein
MRKTATAPNGLTAAGSALDKSQAIKPIFSAKEEISKYVHIESK